ncbi:MAG: SRPBCC family protein [Actinomycetia bacterium]|nr:SRPBCC family protein [Actinomycetes bacterium]
MPVKAQAKRAINAPKDTVWAVLDDFPRISAWSAGIQNSYTTGNTDLETGEGAERRCELGGNKILDERIIAYTPGESMTIDVWNVEGLPLKSSKTTFTLHPTGPGTTEATIDAEVTPKLPGLLVKLIGPIVAKGVAKNFSGLLDELAQQAET